MVSVSMGVGNMEPLLCTDQGKKEAPLSYMLGLCCSYEAGSPASPLNPGLGSSGGARALHGTEGFGFGGRVLGGG